MTVEATRLCQRTITLQVSKHQPGHRRSGSLMKAADGSRNVTAGDAKRSRFTTPGHDRCAGRSPCHLRRVGRGLRNDRFYRLRDTGRWSAAPGEQGAGRSSALRISLRSATRRGGDSLSSRPPLSSPARDRYHTSTDSVVSRLVAHSPRATIRHHRLPIRTVMAESDRPTPAMLSRIAAQLMVLYDEAMNDKDRRAAEAYARALNILRTETQDVRITFDGPPPILRKVPRVPFPDDYRDRLSPSHQPSDSS